MDPKKRKLMGLDSDANKLALFHCGLSKLGQKWGEQGKHLRAAEVLNLYIQDAKNEQNFNVWEIRFRPMRNYGEFLKMIKKK